MLAIQRATAALICNLTTGWKSVGCKQRILFRTSLQPALQFLSIILALVVLAGCQRKTVASDLSQNEAQQVVSVLYKNGLSTDMTQGRGANSFSVTVPVSEAQKAIDILFSNKLPRPSMPSAAELLSEKGFFPNTPEVEQLRLDRTRAAILEETLQKHPRVLSASVIINSQERDLKLRDASIARRGDFTPLFATGGGVNSKDGAADASASLQGLLVPEEERERSSVVVVIAAKPGEDLSKEELMPLILRAVPGSSASSVSLTVSTSTKDDRNADRLMEVLFFKVPESSYGTVLVVLIGLLGLSLIIGGILGYWAGFTQRAKQFFEQDDAFGKADLPQRVRLNGETISEKLGLLGAKEE